MLKLFFFIPSVLFCLHAPAQQSSADSVNWVQVATDSGVVHAAIARPQGTGPFPAIIILHGTHGFAEEYVTLARRMAQNGIMGIAVCWFAGRRGEGTRFITPIDFNDAPPFVEAPGYERFRLARQTIDSLIKYIATLTVVKRDRIAIFGHSRGGGAALDYVLSHPGVINAAIFNSTGYPPEITKRGSGVKIPILILHGTADNPADGGSPVTSIEMARQFETALRAVNNNVEVKYYEGGRHNGLFSDDVQLDDTVRRIADFLQKQFLK